MIKIPLSFNLLSLYFPTKRWMLASICFGSMVTNTWGQDENHSHSANKSTTNNEQQRDIEEVEVLGRKARKNINILGQPEVVLEGDTLQIDTSNTLGETLSKQLGVNNASFGPSVGIPVLRGLSGVRVRLVQDGAGAWDGANLSGDHATTLEASAAKSIRIVRGPSALKEGGGAIGGIVEVLTNRVPLLNDNTQTDIDVNLQSRHELLNKHQQRVQKASIDAQVDKFSVHADGFFRKHNNVGITGKALDIESIEQQFGDVVQFNFQDELPNTESEASNYAFGTAWTSDNWALGVATSQLNNDYGLPIGAHTELRSGGHNHSGDAHQDSHGSENGIGIVATPVRLNMHHARHEAKLRWTPDNTWINQLTGQVARVDYEHSESELGRIGTNFYQDATESKVTIDWKNIFGFKGSIGWQGIDRLFAASGIEAFVPATELYSNGLFFIAEREWSRWQFSVGGRTDLTHLDPLEPTAPYQGQRFFFSPIDYTASSAQMALHFQSSANTEWHFGISQSQRTPDIHELLSFGPHLATRTFDIGSVIRQGALKPETFNHIEIGLEKQILFGNTDIGQLQAQAFASDAQDFIYQQNTGLLYDRESNNIQGDCSTISECLIVVEYTQQDSQFYGYEIKWGLPQFTIAESTISGELFSDYVRGQFKEEPVVDQIITGSDSAKDIPRLPPLRWGAEINIESQHWNGSIRATRISAQTHAGLNELPTDGYWLANANVVYRPNKQWMAFLRGKNLLDEPIRNATSFLRHYAPEPGRSIEFGISFDF